MYQVVDLLHLSEDNDNNKTHGEASSEGAEPFSLSYLQTWLRTQQPHMQGSKLKSDV